MKIKSWINHITVGTFLGSISGFHCTTVGRSEICSTAFDPFCQLAFKILACFCFTAFVPPSLMEAPVCTHKNF